MKKKNGFTLIEIIVSLMIASIAMIIATTLILNSMGYFNKTALSDQDKQALDGIKEYFQNELIYASEVRIATEVPDDSKKWHWLYVKNGQLYRDNNFGYSGDIVLEDINVYNGDYYNNRNLEIIGRGFGEYRIDLKFIFGIKGTDEIAYETKTTIELLNFKKNISSGTVSLKDSSNTLNGIYKIFYKNEGLNIEKEEIRVDDGTVADEYNCIKGSKNDKGDYDEKTSYSKGNYVYYKGNWYKSLSDNNINTQPGESWLWKPLMSEFQIGMNYEKGDIVFYNQKYYQAKYDNAGAAQAPDNTESGAWYGPFESVEKAITVNNILPDYFKCPIDYGTVEDNDYDITTAVKWFPGNKNKGTLIWERMGSGLKEYRYYVTITAGYSNKSPSETGLQYTIWKCINNEYDKYSKYEIGDVVYVDINGIRNYYRVIKNTPDTSPLGNIVNPSKDTTGSWEKVKKDDEGNWISDKMN